MLYITGVLCLLNIFSFNFTSINIMYALYVMHYNMIVGTVLMLYSILGLYNLLCYLLTSCIVILVYEIYNNKELIVRLTNIMNKFLDKLLGEKRQLNVNIPYLDSIEKYDKYIEKYMLVFINYFKEIPYVKNYLSKYNENNEMENKLKQVEKELEECIDMDKMEKDLDNYEKMSSNITEMSHNDQFQMLNELINMMQKLDKIKNN